MTIPAEIHNLRTRLLGWLFDDALPIWATTGTDFERGGFFEKITHDGMPVEAPRRARVVTRQIWSFSKAGELGWKGPWREIVAHGLATLIDNFQREDGLFRILVNPDGSPLDDAPNVYEQAFCMLALSAAQRALGQDFEPMAIRTREALLQRMVRADGGVYDDETGAEKLLANPMMHLFEATQAWIGVGKDPGWRTLADSIARTAVERMIDLETGALGEVYGPDWRRVAKADIEPGHQFEWGWLLLAHGDGHCEAASRLIDVAERHGIEDGIAIFSLDQALAPRDRAARLWAQTERLHAHLSAGRWGDAVQGAIGLDLYLDTPIAGLWRDRLTENRTFVDEPAPASSLYHIVNALLQLDAVCKAELTSTETIVV